MKKTILVGTLFSFMLMLLAFQPKQKQQNPFSASMARGKKVYTSVCMACHQADGGGVPHLNAPLDAASAVIGKNKSYLIRVVLKGMTERVEIDGEYYSNNMSAHADLTNQQIADVLTFIRNSWSNKAGWVTLEEVKKERLIIK